MARKYLLHYAIAHPEFRFPDLQSVSELFDFKVTLPEDEEARDPHKPFLIIELEEEIHAFWSSQFSVRRSCAEI
jgi:tRNA (guanine10-N2)-methyltransferase